MKRLIGVIVCAVLILTSVSAFAQEIDWADLEAQGAELIAQGDFVTFDELAVKMWMPDAFIAIDLTQEDMDGGLIAYYIAPDAGAAVSVTYVDMDGMTLEEYATALTETGVEEVEEVVINGLPAVSYEISDNDTACVAFTNESGYILEIAGSPKSDEEFASVMVFIMASLQNI